MPRLLRTAACVVAAMMALGSSAAVAGPPSSITVFGDSLVDAGNIYTATGGAIPSTAAGYQNGRFTNGYDYTDLLSIALYGTPTRASLLGGGNYAFGGARVVDTGDAVPDLAAQFAAYQMRLGASGKADATGLYILNFGGNDVFGADQGSIGTYTSTDAYLHAAATQYAAGVQALNNLGARNILITGFPVATSASSFTAESYLNTALNGLTLAPETVLDRYSYLSFFGRLQANPGAFGLPALDQSTTCQAARAYPSCTGIFSFDGTHPTAAVQAALFRDINAQFNLTGVPEPGTWAMLVVGFGLAGAALRRRGRKGPVRPALPDAG